MTALPGKPASNSAQAENGYEKVLSVPPGERLQKARAEKRLEISDVAERLNLSAGVVRALEADDYRMLPNSTFVKGYLRSYARVLEISGDDLVRAYEALTGCDKPTKIEPIAPPMIRESRNGLKYSLVVLVLVAVSAAVFWYWPATPSTTETSAQATTPQPAAQVVPVETKAAAATAPASAPETETQPQAESQPESQPEAPAEDNAVESGADAGDGNDSGAAVDNGEQADTAPEVGSATVMDSPLVQPGPAQNASQSETAAVSAVPQVTTGPQGKLTLTFNNDCWVEIRDAADQIVYSSLKHAGDVVNLSVTTPAKVKLGDGDAATVSFNDKPVNYTTTPNRKVIRLTLGE